MKKIKEKNRIFKFNKFDIIIFSIITIIFISVLLAYFPGLLTSDCVSQIEQAKNNDYVDSHPILHSFIIGNLTKISGIWVPALFQILIFSISWTYACKVMRRYNNSNKIKIFQMVITLIIAVIPLNFLYAITLWKDILYSYAIFVLLIYVYIGLKNRFNYSNLEMVFIGIVTVAIMRLRHNGLPIGIIMFFILLILNYVYNKNIKQAVKMIVCFLISFVILSLPKWTLNTNKNNSGNVNNAITSTEIYCIGAFLNSDIEIEQEDLEFLNKILDINEWKNSYSPYSGVGIHFNSKLDKGLLYRDETIEEVNRIFMKYSMQYPGIVVRHFVSVNSLWWSVHKYYWTNTVITDNSYISEMSNGIYDNHPIWKYGNEKINSYVTKIFNNEILSSLIYRPVFAIIISSVLMILVSIRKYDIKYLLILFPMILNIVTYIPFIASQDHRYFYPSYMTEYISILIFAETFIKIKIKNRDNIKNEIDKNKIKTLVIIPAYNEEKSIKNVVNEIYNQKLKDVDVLVVNDGSRDKTYEEAIKTEAKVINLPNNLGIGGAVQTGYIYAYKNNYDIAIQIDGDGQHDPKYITDLINEVLKGNNLVIGSRFIKKTSYNQTFFRMFGINLISLVIKILTGKKIYDTTSGFRAADKNIIEEFANAYPYDYPEPCTTMKMINLNYKINEIPVEMRKRETGVSSISPIKSISYMIKVTMSLLMQGLIE